MVRRRIWAPALLQEVHSGESRASSRRTHSNSALGAVQGPTLGGSSRNEKWEEDGIALSLPKMIQADAAGIELGLHYTTSDYVVLLVIILATVLIMASVVSILSALSKDVKNAGTMIVPFMLVVMFCGLMPMFQNGTPESLVAYLIPFYNSIQVMTATFAHEMTWMPVIVTLAANVLYTGIAVWVLTRLFNSEKVMFSK